MASLTEKAEISMFEPGESLLVHPIPDGVLQRALQHRERRPPRFTTVAAAAIALIASASFGWVAHEFSGETVTAPGMPIAVDEGRIPVTLEIRAPTASAVTLAGSWNNWDADALKLSPGDDGTFHIVVLLPPGRYEYMFVLDGTEWVSDPERPLKSADDFGLENTILDV